MNVKAEGRYSHFRSEVLRALWDLVARAKLEILRTKYGTSFWVDRAMSDHSETPSSTGMLKTCILIIVTECNCYTRIDLDIEGGLPQFYAEFVDQIRSHTDKASKRCVFMFFVLL